MLIKKQERIQVHMFCASILMNSSHTVKSMKLEKVTLWYTIFFDWELITISLMLICMAENLQNRF